MSAKDKKDSKGMKDDSNEKKKTKKAKKSKKMSGSKEVDHQVETQDAGRPWGSQNPPVSGPATRTVKVNRSRSNQSHSGSKGDFLSKLSSNKNYLLGLAGVVAGGALLFKGVKGKLPFSRSTSKIDLSSKVTIDKPREELYSYWRNLENLPNFMSHLEEVEELNSQRSRWSAEIPGGLGDIEWEAEIIQERENSFLSWRSLPGAEIENSGEVRFEDAPGGKGTIVETTISYSPPAGEAGGLAAKLLNPAFEKVVKKDLKQFKKFMEKGGAPKRKSSPSDRI